MGGLGTLTHTGPYSTSQSAAIGVEVWLPQSHIARAPTMVPIKKHRYPSRDTGGFSSGGGPYILGALIIDGSFCWREHRDSNPRFILDTTGHNSVVLQPATGFSALNKLSGNLPFRVVDYLCENKHNSHAVLSGRHSHIVGL